MKLTGNIIIKQQRIYFTIMTVRLFVFIFISSCYLFDLELQEIKSISSLNIGLKDDQNNKIVGALLFVPSLLF